MSQTVEFPEDLTLMRELGAGSCARVYLAREPALGRLVAVKVLHPSLAADDVTRLRFEREAKATAVIRHPNVVSVHRVGHLPTGEPFLVMEYVEGRSLPDLLQARGSLPVEEARRIIVSIAHGLAAAHRKGIVHRDVRPDNVIIEEDTDRVVLLDFGIAAILDTEATAATRLPRPGQLVGSIRYMSPEQLAGERPGEQSDIYALGVLAYDLLSGRSAAKAPSAPPARRGGRRRDAAFPRGPRAREHRNQS
jgi:eukaryotic-like serine/threonine-protein kinase